MMRKGVVGKELSPLTIHFFLKNQPFAWLINVFT
jgi:hypothetical protein